MVMQYKNPPTTPSSIGPQSVTAFHIKKALTSARRAQFFTQLASVRNMPKHFGKTMTINEYLPLLDNRNVNDQGIDASGATIADGNLYGSSKDVGTIVGKLPLLTETGGRVNRVGFKRIQRSGSLTALGFFTEFTQEQLDFDSDDSLFSHLSEEMVKGANEISEDLLQKDLLLQAGVVIYSGAATSNATVTGEGATPSVISYSTLQRLSVTLDENRTPKQTKVISGSRNQDTRTVSSGRVLYIGSELLPLFENMENSFGDAAWIPVQKYADAANVLIGEEGAIHNFRVVVVPEMMHWAGAGAAATAANGGYRTTSVGGTERYDVYPMLVVGDDAFSTIGFQTDGKTVKFKIITKMPGEANATTNDPYGKTGFMSINWYYGTLVYRPERIAVAKGVAPL